jgi:hypothetical protein
LGSGGRSVIQPGVSDKQLQRRRSLYFKLSSRLAELDNERVRALFDQSDPQAGWGRSQVADLDGAKVFLKRVPVTDVEYDHLFSTANLYGLPTFYNYGFGSVGLGVFRELVTHIKTTNWVLAGAIGAFPLLYHYRLIPFDAARADLDPARHARYVAYWGGDAHVDRYLRDRAAARYQLVLFLEHFPHAVGDWLLDHPAKMPLVLADMRAAVTFLRRQGIIHLDAHFFNMVTDGRRVYLTDFGLALDRHFALSPGERQFYRQNRLYDFGYLLWSVGAQLFWMYDHLPDAEKRRVVDPGGRDEEAAFEDLFPVLLEQVDAIASSGMMKIDKRYRASLARYRPVIAFMHQFYTAMRRNNAKDTPWDHAKLRRLLQAVDFLPGPPAGD